MNRLVATVSNIQSVESLNIVELSLGGMGITMMSLELPLDVVLNSQVELTIKPSHITLAKNLSGMLSHSNILPAVVVAIEEGKLLSVIELEVQNYKLESIITTKALQMMQLHTGEAIEIAIKASDISIVERLRD